MDDRILIADDDPSILMLISDVLTDAGMQVRTVTSGEAALRATEKEAFSLIILDIMMQGMSGLEVCAAIRDKVDCPILFLSAKDSAHDIIEGLGLGADDYLTKPFVIDELVARIKAHLRRQARLGENAVGGDKRKKAIFLSGCRLAEGAIIAQNPVYHSDFHHCLPAAHQHHFSAVSA